MGDEMSSGIGFVASHGARSHASIALVIVGGGRGCDFDRGGQSEMPHHGNHQPTRVDLPPFESVARAGREGMMVIMPSLTKTKNPHQGVITTLITRLVIPTAPEMTNAVHAPSDMMNHEDADQSSPEKAEQRPRPGPGNAPGDHCRKEQSDHDPEGKKPIDGDDPLVGQQIRSVAVQVCLIAAVA